MAEVFLNQWMLYGMGGQFLFGGLSSSTKVANMYQTADELCRMNKSLHDQQETLTAALAETQAQLLVDMPQMKATMDGWHNDIDVLNQRSANMRHSWLNQYTMFLGFLAFVTLMLYFAIEKKGGRLHRLFQKIDKITAEANTSS